MNLTGVRLLALVASATAMFFGFTVTMLAADLGARALALGFVIGGALTFYVAANDGIR